MNVLHRPVAILMPPDVEDRVDDGRDGDGHQADDDDSQQHGRGRGLSLVVVDRGHAERHLVGVELVVGVARNPKERDVVERDAFELGRT